MMEQDDMQHDQLPSVEEVKTRIAVTSPSQQKKFGNKTIFLKIVASTLIVTTILSLSVVILVLQNKDCRPEVIPTLDAPDKDCQSDASEASEAILDASGMQGVIRDAVVQKGIVKSTRSTDYPFSDRSIQQRALSKVMKETTLTREMTIQRYALWTFFFATEHVGTPVTNQVFGLGTVPTWKDSWMNDGPDPCLWYGVRCNSFGVVVELNLSDSGITGMLPRELTLLDSLTNLDLSKNIGLGHGGVPIWLKDMDSLQLIDFRSCTFSDNAPLEVCESTRFFYAECLICSCCNLCKGSV